MVDTMMMIFTTEMLLIDITTMKAQSIPIVAQFTLNIHRNLLGDGRQAVPVLVATVQALPLMIDHFVSQLQKTPCGVAHGGERIVASPSGHTHHPYPYTTGVKSIIQVAIKVVRREMSPRLDDEGSHSGYLNGVLYSSCIIEQSRRGGNAYRHK